MPLPTHIEINKSRPLTQELYEYLRASIFDGTLQPGERLVEDAIGKTANVSRTPVREALRKLEMEGLVQTRGRSKSVATPTANELAELVAVREVLEGMATGLAAGARSEMEVQTLKQIHAEYCHQVEQENFDETKELNMRFHETIWLAARNRYLSQQLALLRGTVLRLQRSMLAYPERRLATVLEHEQMLQAIIDRDTQAAEEYGKIHFRNAAMTRLAKYRLQRK